jgi:hypothetical protein
MSSNIYRRLYVARMAPASTTDIEAIRNGVEVLDNHGEVVRESFRPDAWLTTTSPVPVYLSHDEDKGPVGWLTARVVSGGWHVGSFTLDHSRNLSAVAFDRLKRGAPVSIGFSEIATNPDLIDGIKQHTVARLNELSILAPDEVPWYQGAKIVDVLEPKEPIVRAQPSEPGLNPGDEVFYGNQMIRRPCGGQVLGVR